MPALPLLERVEAAREVALDALTHATGTQSLCTLGRERLRAAKYHEGAVVALGDLRRALRRGEPAPTPETWGLGIVEKYAATSPDWRAYLIGGREALSGVRASTPVPAPAATS
ncbi:hypothetical protein GCM10009808_10220 [Microbacterium sediminicola]|uniref:Uncharacterized protein n=1 Tax=Microbacterium sediminicola TaxID=415210 RepID=A0ABN2HXK2_9MICO